MGWELKRGDERRGAERKRRGAERKRRGAEREGKGRLIEWY